MSSMFKTPETVHQNVSRYIQFALYRQIELSVRENGGEIVQPREECTTLSSLYSRF